MDEEQQLQHEIANLDQPKDNTPVIKTIVSPDVVAKAATVDATSGAAAPNGRIILVPMAEWKQCAQRGVRSGIQCGTFLLGGGSLALFAAQFGIAPDMISALPSSGNVALDAVLISITFGLLCFLWNFIEFWLDIDVSFPKWRA